MKTRIAITFLLLVLLVAGGGYFYMQKTQANQIADIKQACTKKYNTIRENVIADVDGFCDCTARVDRSTAEQLKTGGKICMDKYGKAGLLQKCEDMNKEMAKEDPANKGVNCGCFYDKMIDLFAEQSVGTNDLTLEQRRATVAQAFVACKN